VAKVIAEARARSTALGLYLWLVVVTGVRRGELCGLQIRDIDLDRGLVHGAGAERGGCGWRSWPGVALPGR
jgi:integrase